MSETVHLEVIQGEDRSKRISVPESGARIGRSAKNDIVLMDPLLSRHHCRVFFREGQLCITDLGSANRTVVNDEAIQEVKLQERDRITLGDTVIEVRQAVLHGTEAKPPPPPGSPLVDLGFSAEEGEAASVSRKILGRGPLLLIAGLVALLAVAAWLPKLLKPKPIDPIQPDNDGGPAAPPSFYLEYEKVEADTDNIFRYKLVINEKNEITVEMDDLANNRHFNEPKELDPRLARELARDIVQAGFFGLREEYRGVQPNILHRWDISVTVGRQTHRSAVVNRAQPELFRQITEMIEVFGKNEMGLWAQQFTTEKLLEMARDSFLLGKKMYDERDIDYGNLAAAIRSFREAKFHVDTLENKPEYYGELLSLLTDCKEILQKRYNEHNFRAEQYIRLKEWQQAADELQVICELVPNRDDDRNREARTKLLEVETRIRMMRR